MKTWMLAIALLGAAACDDKGDDTGDEGGGGPGVATCDDPFTACGGDPTGAWSFADFCYEFEYSDESCPDATYAYDFDADGSYELLADGTYSVALTTTATATVSFPKTCLGGATCEDLASAGELSCVDAGPVCDCETTQVTSSAEAGTWSTAGSVLTMTDDSGDATKADYCVSGRSFELELRPDSPEEAPIRVILSR
jgi:hypothetical protein